MSHERMQLYAWVGEDELGSGQMGIKQGVVPAGCVPLVSIDPDKLLKLRGQLQEQANRYGKTIRLCRYKFVEEVIKVEPS